MKLFRPLFPRQTSDRRHIKTETKTQSQPYLSRFNLVEKRLTIDGHTSQSVQRRVDGHRFCVRTLTENFVCLISRLISNFYQETKG